MNTSPTITIERTECRRCSKVFKADRYEFEFNADTLVGPKVCPACKDAERRKLDQEVSKKRESNKGMRFDQQKTKIIPERYRDTRLNHSDFNSQLNGEISSWNPTREKPWVGVYGPVGVCKTRCVALRLEEFIKEGKQCKFINGADMSNLVLHRFVDKFRTEANTNLRALRSADVLVLDDLGKMGASKAKCQELYGLLEEIMAHNKILLWTANSAPMDFTAGYPDENRDSIQSRILEASEIFEVS